MGRCSHRGYLRCGSIEQFKGHFTEYVWCPICGAIGKRYATMVIVEWKRTNLSWTLPKRREKTKPKTRGAKK